MNFSKVLAASLICGAALCSCNNPAKVGKLKVQEDSVSYALGYNTGVSYGENLNQFPGGDSVVDRDLLIAGFINGLKGDTTKMTADQAMKVIQDYFQDVQKKEAAAEADAYMKSKDANDAYMAEKAKEEGFKKIYGRDSSMYVLIKETQAGSGAKITDESFAYLNYTGKLKDGSTFDTSEGREPAMFPVSRVIPGFTMALKELKAGSKATIIIPSELGYGRKAVGDGKIPANSILTFDVEILKTFANEKEASAFMQSQAPRGPQGPGPRPHGPHGPEDAPEAPAK